MVAGKLLFQTEIVDRGTKCAYNAFELCICTWKLAKICNLFLLGRCWPMGNLTVKQRPRISIMLGKTSWIRFDANSHLNRSLQWMGNVVVGRLTVLITICMVTLAAQCAACHCLFMAMHWKNIYVDIDDVWKWNDDSWYNHKNHNYDDWCYRIWGHCIFERNIKLQYS